MLTQIVENLLNRNLADSPRARELCEELRGQRLWIVVQGTPLRIEVESMGRSLQLRTHTQSAAPASTATSAATSAALEAPPDETLTLLEATPVNLIALAGEQPERLIQSGAVRVRGDVEVAQRFRELALRLRPDLEEELARLFGDRAARGVGGLAGMLGSFGRRAAVTAVRNTAEYLAHERGDLVPRGEAEAFFSDVERLREDVDRLEARLALLEAAQRP